MRIVLPVYAGMTALDAVGPYVSLSRRPEAIEPGMHDARQPPIGTGYPATALTPARRKLIAERLRN